MPKQNLTNAIPDWEQVLSASAHLQEILPEAVLVGGTATVVYAGHRLSSDADHILTDLKTHFDEVLTQLESVAGWETARLKRPVLILGSLDGIETGVRQLIRSEPLEKQQLDVEGYKITLPTPHEMLRIKGILILKRNATRDYLDFVAMSKYLGKEETQKALLPMDVLYNKDNKLVLRQLITQLATPLPYDLEEIDLSEYKAISDEWRDWKNVEAYAMLVSHWMFESALSQEERLRHLPEPDMLMR